MFVETQGMVKEFHVPKNEDPSSEPHQFQWHYGNGLLGIILIWPFYTALKSRRTRSWLCRTDQTSRQNQL